MAANQQIALTFQSPWNLPGPTHDWHNTFHCSGTTALAPGEMETTALDFASVILAFAANTASLIKWSYYPPNATVAAGTKSYTPGTLPGTQTAYSAPGSTYRCQLEVCGLARCPVGKSSKGRQVYLRKWIHDIRSLATDPDTIGALNSQATIFAKWNTGCGPKQLVPVDPTGGAQGGPWQIEQHLFTHQLRRGSKRKRFSTDVLSQPTSPPTG